MIEERSGSLKPELFSKTAFLYVTTLAGAVFGYISLYFATRFIGSVNYGIVAFALSFVGIFLFVTDLGFGSAHTKKVSEGKNLQACLSVFLLVRLLLVGLFILLVLGAMLVWEVVLGQGYEYPEMRLIILIILLYYIQTSITYVFTSTFLAQRDVLRAQTITLFDIGSRALATLLVVAMGWELIGLACVYVVEGAVSLSVAVVLARRNLPKVSLRAIRDPIFKEYMRFAAPLAVASLFGPIAMYFDKVLIQYSLNAVETGIYYGSQSLLAFYLSLGSIVSAMIYPAISQLSAEKDSHEKISRITASAIRYFLLATMPIMLFLIVFSRELLSIFLSAAFEEGATAFSILVVAYTLGIMLTPFGSQTMGMGMSKLYAKYVIVAMALNLALNVVLIPSDLYIFTFLGLGKEGAALSFLARQALLLILFYAAARRAIQFRLPSRVLHISGAAVIAIAITYYISGLIEITRFYDLVALFLLNGGLFLGFAIIFGAVKKGEISELLGMLRLRNLLHRSRK